MSIELGKFNTLKVVKEVDFGMYLDGGEEAYRRRDGNRNLQRFPF